MNNILKGILLGLGIFILGTFSMILCTSFLDEYMAAILSWGLCFSICFGIVITSKNK